MNQIKIEYVLLLQDVVVLVRADDIVPAFKSFWIFNLEINYELMSSIPGII